MRSIFASAALLLPLFYDITFAHPQTTTTPSSSTACNNSPSLCSRPYSNVTYLGAHDSPFVSNSSNSFDISGNQYYNSTVQLNAGVRLLQAQIQHENGSDTTSPLHLCHSDCSLYDAGTIEGWLREVKTWMDANPNEVVTILFVNGVGADAATLGQIFTNSGITDYAYTPTSSTPSTWPTLQEMISANTRLVTFIASLNSNTGAPFLLNQFDYIWENNYLVTDPSNFTCTPDRPSTLGGSITTATSSGRMFMMNHFLAEEQLFGIQTPNRDAAGSTNSPDTTIIGSLGSSASDCTAQVGAAPNFVLVDWFSVGPAINTVDNLNGITATGRQQVNSADPRTSSSSNDATGRKKSSALALVLGFAIAMGVGWI